MEYLTAGRFKIAMLHVCDLIIESESMLTALDTIIGDGDHGFGMKEGFTDVKKKLQSVDYELIYDQLKDIGIELLRSMGGASGVIFGTMFTAGLSSVNNKDKFGPDDIITFFEEGATTISRRGRTNIGDKTMLDALAAANRKMRERRNESSDVIQIINAAWRGAEEGVEATRSMMPKKGRSKNFREKAIGLPDPGAVSTSIIFRGMYEGLVNKE